MIINEHELAEKGLSTDEIKQERENKLTDIREALYAAVDELVDVLDTVNIADFIQIHIMGNDFTRTTAILHDIYCEMNLDNLRRSDVKTSIGFDQILKVQKQTFDLDMKLGELLIDSEKQINPKGNKIQRLIKKMARNRDIEENAHNIQIYPSRSRMEPHLNSSGVLFVPRNRTINTNEVTHILGECIRMFNMQTAVRLDTMIGRYNAEITQREMSPIEIVVTSAHPNEDHNINEGYLRLNPFRIVEAHEMDELLSVAEGMRYNVDDVRRFLVEHNEALNNRLIHEATENVPTHDEPGDVAQPVVNEDIDWNVNTELESRINFDGISIRNGNIYPPETGYIDTHIHHGLSVAARAINETTERLVRQIIINHNERIINTQEAPGAIEPDPHTTAETIQRDIDEIASSVSSTGFSDENVTDYASVDITREEENNARADTPDERTS